MIILGKDLKFNQRNKSFFAEIANLEKQKIAEIKNAAEDTKILKCVSATSNKEVEFKFSEKIYQSGFAIGWEFESKINGILYTIRIIWEEKDFQDNTIHTVRGFYKKSTSSYK